MPEFRHGALLQLRIPLGQPLLSGLLVLVRAVSPLWCLPQLSGMVVRRSPARRSAVSPSCCWQAPGGERLAQQRCSVPCEHHALCCQAYQGTEPVHAQWVGPRGAAFQNGQGQAGPLAKRGWPRTTAGRSSHLQEDVAPKKGHNCNAAMCEAALVPMMSNQSSKQFARSGLPVRRCHSLEQPLQTCASQHDGPGRCWRCPP